MEKLWALRQMLINWTQGPTPPAKDAPYRGVELCRRTAIVDEFDAAGIGFAKPDHWFVRTKSGYRGEGPVVPGTPYYSLPHIAVADHGKDINLPGVHCEPVNTLSKGWDHVDEQCMDERMTLGRDLGYWVPAINDCQTTIKDALNACNR